MKGRFLELFEYHRSMNEAMIRYLDQPEFVRHEEMQEQMNRVFNVHGKWLARIEGKRAPYLEERVHSPRDMDDVDRENHEWTQRILDREELDQPVRYRDELGRVSWDLLSNILFQIIMHGIHQRGRVAMLLERFGHKAPDLGYLAWCKEG